MADATRAKDDAPTPAQAAREAKPDSDEPTYSRDRLMEEAYALTGYEAHVLAGALSAVPKKNLTVSEVKAAVKAFLSTEVSQ